MSSPSRARTPSLARERLATAGRYVIHREIARGGMAVVHLARLIGPAGFSRIVAVKQMRIDLEKESEFVAMFLDEAWLASRIQHPNVVPTLDVVADAQGLFIVMEYVRGAPLSMLRRAERDRERRIPPGIAATVVCHALAGLQAAHEAVREDGAPLGIVHRDVSPQNVLVGVDGLSRIMDFGVALATSRLHVTRGESLKGKLAYMPPEQLKSEELDRRADLFAAGVILWELLAGEPLFGGGTFDETVAALMGRSIPPIASLRDDVSPAVDQVLARALARDRDARFATAEEFAVALEAAVPLASARAVGAWVREVAREPLAKRADLERWIEAHAEDDTEAPERGLTPTADVPMAIPTLATRTPTSGSDVSTIVFARKPEARESVPATETPPARPARSRWGMAIAAALSVAIGGSLALLVTRSGKADPGVAVDTEGAAARFAPPLAPPPLASAPTEPTVVAAAPLADASAAAPPSASAPPRTKPKNPPRATPPAKGPASEGPQWGF